MANQTTEKYSGLIESSRVEGASVYDATGERIGRIEELLIDKVTGKVAYAMLGFGGFLGVGEEFFPLPWAKLSYDVPLRGYRTDVTREQVKSAPARYEDWHKDRSWEEAYHSHYGLPPYWF